MLLIAIITLFLGFTTSVAGRCGTRPPSNTVRALHIEAEVQENAANARRTLDQRIFGVTVNTYVHVIQPVGSTVDLTARAVEQISVLNTHFANSNTGFRFNLVSQQTIQNDAWVDVVPESAQEFEMKSTLRQGRYRDLNVYIVTIENDPPVLGYATFPEQHPSQTTRSLDGVVVIPNSLPGGVFPNDLGLTGVHEVGHWLSLVHTFEPDPNSTPVTGCTGPGDYIIDTPAEDSPAYGCPVGRDSCQNQRGLDPITNYMDYTDDACMTQFTLGQGLRMRTLFATLRSFV
ncbi:hypothetical protein BJX68DRAFT_265521 [Aspergillus pseudodeflectus]|uniref:Peptidase M43 pregnancy-associated plasma-A domain-containing protein n=1 Tax=Aspergillus pseudodeflectus TaxID=176178 RepID=A0ABR4KK27_9EURO